MAETAPMGRPKRVEWTVTFVGGPWDGQTRQPDFIGARLISPHWSGHYRIGRGASASNVIYRWSDS